MRCAPRKALSPAISLSEAPGEENPLDQQAIERGAHQSKLLPAKLSTDFERKRSSTGRRKARSLRANAGSMKIRAFRKGTIAAHGKCRRRPGSLLSASTKLPSLRHRRNEVLKFSKRKFSFFTKRFSRFPRCKAVLLSRRLISINVYFIFGAPERRLVDTGKYFSRQKLKIILKRKLC